MQVKIKNIDKKFYRAKICCRKEAIIWVLENKANSLTASNVW